MELLNAEISTRFFKTSSGKITDYKKWEGANYNADGDVIQIAWVEICDASYASIDVAIDWGRARFSKELSFRVVRNRIIP